jgi:ribosomal protein L29
MKKIELRDKEYKDVEKAVADLEQKVKDVYFDMRLGKVKNVRQPKMLRKQLAVAKTILKEKQKDKLTKGGDNGIKNADSRKSKKQ